MTTQLVHTCNVQHMVVQNSEFNEEQHVKLADLWLTSLLFTLDQGRLLLTRSPTPHKVAYSSQGHLLLTRSPTPDKQFYRKYPTDSILQNIFYIQMFFL